MKKRHAFTLIEMLVVIAIIGIVAALVVNMNSGAQAAKKRAQVDAEKSSLIAMITDYQSKLNFYPPDNTNLDNYAAGNYASNYDLYSATNALLYELTGATNLTNGNIQIFDGTSNITQTIFAGEFGRLTVANANPDEPHDFYGSAPLPKEYTNYAGSVLEGLLVPVPLVLGLNPDNTIPINFWHYDSSSTNRHNLQSYDLWAEYISANNHGSNIITTNGNW